jgi:hypothetical protein
MKNRDYENDDDFPVKLSKIYSLDKEDFTKQFYKIRTSFFKRNKVKKVLFLQDLLKELSKEKYSDDVQFPKQIFIDDITNFNKVKKVRKSKGKYLDILESDVKALIKHIIEEHKEQKDWGGEQSDLFTTKLTFNKKRLPVAICLKGRGKKGVLQISDCGKNGDQIIRLFKEPAQLFIWQYVGDISSPVYDMMQTCAYKKSEGGAKEVYYCIIDGSDTERLFKAYSQKSRVVG